MTVSTRATALAVATSYYKRVNGGKEKTDIDRNALIAKAIQAPEDPELRKAVNEALSGMTPFQRLVFGMSEGLFGGYVFSIKELTTVLSKKAGRPANLPIDLRPTLISGPLLSARQKLHPDTRQLSLF